MRIKRIAAVTAGLMLAGWVFGTIAGIAMMIAWGIIAGDLFEMTARDVGLVFRLSPVLGGVPGAVLGPIAAWLLMRHVPLGVAVGGTTLGTLAGGGLSLLATADPRRFLGVHSRRFSWNGPPTDGSSGR